MVIPSLFENCYQLDKNGRRGGGSLGNIMIDLNTDTTKVMVIAHQSWYNMIDSLLWENGCG